MGKIRNSNVAWEIEKLMNKFAMKLVTVIHELHCLKTKKEVYTICIHKINKARLLYQEDFMT